MQERLKSIGLSISEISELLGVSRPTLYKYMDAYAEGKVKEIKSGVLDLFRYVDSDPNITKKEVLLYLMNDEVNTNKDDIDSCFNEGIMDYDMLLSLDDIKLYEKYKNCPVGTYELVIESLRNGTPREQLATALKYNLDKITHLIVINAGKGRNFGNEYADTVEEYVDGYINSKNIRYGQTPIIVTEAISSRNRREKCIKSFKTPSRTT